MLIKTQLVGVVALMALGVGIAYIGNVGNVRGIDPGSGIACTMEAKLCPDGSAVGRSGPNCEFSACPVVDTPTPRGSIFLEARMGQEVSGLDVRIVPLEILEDSRCPVDVQCIQAGTVRIRARLTSGLGEANQEFKLNQPVTTEAERITLIAVSPSPKAGINIKDSDYRFSFEVAKRTDNLPFSNSGVRGTVMLGPTCPVMRDPPDPNCADRGYSTKISVFRASDNNLIATTKSDAQGAFEVSLPAGDYVISATGGQMLPRCSPVTITVSTNNYVSAPIQCDTGIR